MCGHLIDAGVRVVIAHGGGDELTAWQAARKRKTTWHNGLRVTDDQTRDDAVLVFRGLVVPVSCRCAAAGRGVGGRHQRT